MHRMALTLVLAAAVLGIVANDAWAQDPGPIPPPLPTVDPPAGNGPWVGSVFLNRRRDPLGGLRINDTTLLNTTGAQLLQGATGWAAHQVVTSNHQAPDPGGGGFISYSCTAETTGSGSEAVGGIGLTVSLDPGAGEWIVSVVGIDSYEQLLTTVETGPDFGPTLPCDPGTRTSTHPYSTPNPTVRIRPPVGAAADDPVIYGTAVVDCCLGNVAVTVALHRIACNTAIDTDGDGLSDCREIEISTNPYNPDTDGDGLGDAPEDVGVTDPLDPDTDDDGRSDGDEVNGADPTNPVDSDTDDDGQPDGTDPFPTDPTNNPGPRDPCTSATAQRASWHAIFRGYIELSAFFDADLYRFVPEIHFCYDGISAKVTRAVQFNGLDEGFDSAALEPLGFELAYDHDQVEQSTPILNRASFVSGVFQLRFDASKLVDRFGVKDHVEKAITKQLTKRLRPILARFGVGPQALREIRIHVINVRDKTLLEADKALRKLARPLPDRAVTWLRQLVNDKITEHFDAIEQILNEAISPEAFGDATAEEVSAAVAAAIFERIEEATSFWFDVWQPQLEVTVRASGSVSYEFLPSIQNPLLSVELLSIDTQEIEGTFQESLATADSARQASRLHRAFSLPAATLG